MKRSFDQEEAIPSAKLRKIQSETEPLSIDEFSTRYIAFEVKRRKIYAEKEKFKHRGIEGWREWRNKRDKELIKETFSRFGQITREMADSGKLFYNVSNERFNIRRSDDNEDLENLLRKFKEAMRKWKEVNSRYSNYEFVQKCFASKKRLTWDVGLKVKIDASFLSQECY